MLYRLCSVLLLGLAAAQAQVVVFSDNMDNFPTGWVRRRFAGSADWTRMGTRFHTPSYSAKCTNAGVYAPNLSNSFARAVDLTGYNAASLKFWYWCQTELGYDSVRLEFHSGTTWTGVWRRGGTSDWDTAVVSVPINTDSIRFRFVSDAQVQFEGVYIDDVVLTGYQPDVGVTGIVAPTGVVDTGTGIYPSCWVYNYSPLTANYWVACRIGTSYRDSTYVSHPGMTAQQVSFLRWFAAPRGDLAVCCSTRLSSDMRPQNDAREITVRVRVHDVAAAEVLSPPPEMDSGYGVTPRATVRNPGGETESFSAVFTIGSYYSDTRTVAGLNPGETATVTFASRILNCPRGTFSARCSTMLTTDRNHANDARFKAVTVRVHDVGASALIAPGSTLDSGELVTPRAAISNYGTTTESFRCMYRIGPYCDTQQVTNLAPGNLVYVDFAQWRAVPGNYTRVCSTMCLPDLQQPNNRVTGPLFVGCLDAGVTRILAPNAQVQPGLITPLVEVKNFGNLSADNFPLTLRINPGYVQTQTLSVPPGRCDTVIFPDWNATAGTYQAGAKLTLFGDMNMANDSVGKTVAVGGVHHDVGVSAIVVPDTQVDPGNVAPRVFVFNYGSILEANVPVVFRVENAGGTVFVDTQRLSSINPGEELEVQFRTWLAYTGDFTVSSWTRLAGDEQPANDTTRRSVLVALHSVCPTEVLSPIGTVGRGYPVTPSVLVRNRGSVPDSFPVHMTIEHDYAVVYQDSARCLVDPGDTVEVLFPTWTPPDTGGHQTMAWTSLSRDFFPHDDTIEDNFRVAEPLVDAAADSVLSPAGTISADSTTPSVMLSNQGNVRISFWAHLLIGTESGPAYEDSGWVDALTPGSVRQIELPAWSATAGNYDVTLTVICPGDVASSNDTAFSRVIVRQVGRWTEKPGMPLAPSGKEINKGGCITALAGSPPTLYALKGNKTADFFRYRVSDSAWETPSLIPPGSEAKMPADGAALTNDGNRYVYATKGNNTRAFWRYDVVDDSWTQMPDVPLSPSNKKVKGGASLAYAVKDDTGNVYLLKGNKTDFFRYNTAADSWILLPPAPIGTRAKWDKGSWLVGDGTRLLYAHKAKYHELWCYDVDADSWLATQLTGMPFVSRSGRSKKSKDGGCATWSGNALFAFKGGNTQEFWAYFPVEREWVEFETIPRLGSTGKTKKVKAGAGLAWLDGCAWALKGNKTRELWSYSPVAVVRPAPGRQGVQSRPPFDIRQSTLMMWPNPALRLSGVRVACSWPGNGPALLTFYDAAGRLARQMTVCNPKSAMTLDLRNLPRGVYFVRMSAAGVSLSRKLIVE